MQRKRKGYTIEINLSEECGYNNYIIVCTYKYNKWINKYSLEMELKHKDIGDGFRIDRQEIDTQYISGTRETIEDNIERIVNQAYLSGFFDEYIKRYEYTFKCFEKGNDFFEQEKFKNEKEGVIQFEM